MGRPPERLPTDGNRLRLDDQGARVELSKAIEKPVELSAITDSSEVEILIATTLTGIRAWLLESGPMIDFEADGLLTKASHFISQNPARLVINLPGIQNAVAHKVFRLNSPGVKRIRVGTQRIKFA